MNTIGHKNIYTYFDKVQKNNRMHHAYCFAGQHHVGKRHVAHQLAKKILQVQDVHLSPDYSHLKIEKNPKTGKTRKVILVEQVRDLRIFLQMTSSKGGNKVAIIETAELMGLAASNALLKTLEEPTKNTFIILLTTDEQQLLPTVRSRVHTIYFEPLTTSEMHNGFKKLHGDHLLFEEIIGWSHGLPGLATTLFTQKEVAQEYKKEIDRFYNFINAPFSDKLKGANEMFGDKSDHIKQRSHIINVLEIWQLIIQDIWRARLGQTQVYASDTDTSAFTESLMLNLLKKIEIAKSQLNKNVHPRLSVEQILLDIP